MLSSETSTDLETLGDLMTVKDAAEWASQLTGRDVTESNISYLVQYGRVPKISANSVTMVNKNDLVRYYDSSSGNRESRWTKKLGQDLNWTLAFDDLKESERTKHVHRLHPYKGKFIPQLVEYFLDDHINGFKKQVYFHPGDIVLDPFCGSGTLLVQANELGMHAIGVDISEFNAMISNVKIADHDFNEINSEIDRITSSLVGFVNESGIAHLEQALGTEISRFNNANFPAPDYRAKVVTGEIDEMSFGKAKEEEFRQTYQSLIEEAGVEMAGEGAGGFIDQWFGTQIKRELELVRNIIVRVPNCDTRNVLTITLSRTMRSCRATTHFDLATLKEPVTSAYYCHKHGKICMPLLSILGWWKRYSKDTVKRLVEFQRIRTDTYQLCLTGDSRTIDIAAALEGNCRELANLVRSQKIKGIFSSPPYVGLIDYHEQHAYAYEMFGITKRDQLEIGRMSKGQGKEAKKDYVKSISDVLLNCERFLADDSDIFLVANDKFNLYENIAEQSKMVIVDRFKRPVLDRTERDKGAYSETIFHMKRK